MVRLSIVFGFKNRDGLRVRRCLDSLVAQEVDQFEVIFVDYGSEPKCREEIEPIVKSYSFARYVYCDMRGRPWNRAHALNIGIRMAQAELVMTSDIDLIFNEFPLKKIIDNYDGKTALHAGCYYLPQNFDQWGKLSVNKSRYGKPVQHSLGLLLLLPKSAYMRLGGFDEFYKFWGREDADIEQRLNKIGFETRFLNIDEFPLYHQWHPVQNHTTFSLMPSGYWTQALFHFGQYENVEKRNDSNGMGCLIGEKERPSLLFMDGVLKPSIKLDADAGLEMVLVKNFLTLKDGEAIEIKSDWVEPEASWENFVIHLNHFLERKGINFYIDYKKNKAKEVFWSFIGSYPELIKDFAYTGDERKFYLVRRG